MTIVRRFRDMHLVQITSDVLVALTYHICGGRVRFGDEMKTVNALASVVLLGGDGEYSNRPLTRLQCDMVDTKLFFVRID